MFLVIEYRYMYTVPIMLAMPKMKNKYDTPSRLSNFTYNLTKVKIII